MFEKFPPTDFVPTASAVPGIEVYRPRSPEEAHQPVVEFNCPQCGSQTAYSAADGGLTCTSCSYYEPPRAAIVGVGAEEFEFTVEAIERSAHGWGEERKELQCQNCGVYTSIPRDMLTHTCPFCDSNKVIQHQAPQDLLRPRFLIPFKIEAEACQRIAREWLGSNWMVPKALQRAIVSGPFDGVYVPFWTFDAALDAHWKAEVGRRRKSDNKLIWQWRSGHHQEQVDDFLVLGSTHLSRLLVRRINHYDLQALAPYEPKYLAGFQAQNYDLPLEKAWEVARRQIRQRVKKTCHSQTNSNRVRNFSMSLDFQEERWRYILLPFYLSSYQYRQKSYQVLVNGQTGAISGQRPVGWIKVFLIIFLVMVPAFSAGVAGIIQVKVYQAEQSGWFCLGFVFFLVGAVVALKLLAEALQLDDA